MILSATSCRTATTPNKGSLSSNNQSCQNAQEDTVSLGEQIKDTSLTVLKASVGALGATVGGAMGVLPGMAYALDRKLNTEKLVYNVSTGETSVVPNSYSNMNTETENVRSAWGVSYALLGAAVGGAAGYFGIGPGPLALMSAVAGGAAGIGLQHAFRSAGQHSVRMPHNSDVFTTTLTECADRRVAGSYISGILGGAKVGMREGAHLGKLAFQDLLVPSKRPTPSTPYSAK